MLTVACVLKSGGDFAEDDVAYLHGGINRHLKGPVNLVCLSDMNPGSSKMDLLNRWPGWWSKMELFRLDPPVLYFDLDTVITGDLADIAQQAMKPELTVLKNFYDDVSIGSGMMGWNIDLSHLYTLFSANPQKWMDKHKFIGDQRFIQDHMSTLSFWQDKVPGQVVSYKANVKPNNKIPEGARVVCFHGNPRPRQVQWLTSFPR